MFVERPIPKNTIDYYLDKILELGFEVQRIEPYSTAGDITPPCWYQWLAVTKLRPGDDDAIKDNGNTPFEAVYNLYKYIKGIADISMEDEEL
jgi:hypothetical protein